MSLRVYAASVVALGSKRRDPMELSAPTRIVFIIVAAGVLGAYSYWLLLVAFIVLAIGNLLKGV
jgi:hypothetical protein